MSPAPGPSSAALESPLGKGLRRSVGMFRAFLVEQSDPDTFYRTQAADTLAQVARHMDLDGRLVIDIGGGAGYFSQAFRGAGARSYLIEPEAGVLGQPVPGGANGASPHSPERRGDDRRRAHAEAVRPGRLVPGGTVAGDGYHLPFPAGLADLTFSSNVLEHVPAAEPFLEEMVRVTRPGGLLYLSFTAWFSPWGGHETSPWHYLGGRRAAARYERINQRPPGNLYGRSLFAQHVGPVLRLARNRADLEILEAIPRYYPSWLDWVVKVPGLRELATWNLLLVMRRRPAGPARP
ncbi:MAG TPA: class I SAM-dependent methyltransferase [Acidimicrobiales bacterium]|nr:class I SAM-dependent methyltransferase [Acidimicrobiales bacterium]